MTILEPMPSRHRTASTPIVSPGTGCAGARGRFGAPAVLTLAMVRAYPSYGAESASTGRAKPETFRSSGAMLSGEGTGRPIRPSCPQCGDTGCHCVRGTVRLLGSYGGGREVSIMGGRSSVSHGRAMRLLAVPLLLVALSVSSCSGDAAVPKPLASSSAKTTLAPTPTAAASPASAAAPPMPGNARGTSDASAEAFVRHYLKLINYASHTGSTSSLHKAGTKSCQSCSALALFLDRIYSKGGRIKSNGWFLKKIRFVAGPGDSQKVATLVVWQSPEKVTEGRGKASKSFKGGEQRMTIHLVNRSQSWLVNRLDLVI